MKLVCMICVPHYLMMMCCVIVWQSMRRLVGKQVVVLGTGGLQPHNVVSIDEVIRLFTNTHRDWPLTMLEGTANDHYTV